MTTARYGSMCHRCSHLLGTSHDLDPLFPNIPITGLRCQRCLFCQEAVFLIWMDDRDIDHFHDAHFREGWRAFRERKNHPFLDEIREGRYDEEGDAP